ncbi:MAG: YbjN domain-containing protein [Deltaproteobacteria bacterium]|nr:YbjN domain-containing protein [Deltaproteobacteria bacterium]
MRTKADIESYLMRSHLAYEEVADSMWVVSDPANRVTNLVVKQLGPILLFRLKVIDVPDAGREALFHKLLDLNATSLLHVAYGLEEGAVVLTHASEIESMDYNEFQAVVDEMAMAMTEHHEALSPYHRPSAPPAVKA